MKDSSAIYFFDRNKAMETALQQNHVKFDGLYDVLQVCYHDGEPFHAAPRNLIHVPVEKFVETFSSTGYCLPQKIIIGDRTDEAKGANLISVIEAMDVIRKIKMNCDAQILSCSKPDFGNDRPWRIYLPTSRYTDVWQYCMKNLAKAFRKKGCDTRVVIEENDLQNFIMSPYEIIRRAADYKPHIWVSISEGVYNFLHPDMYRVIWWQDPRPPLGTGERPEWRERDILFSQYRFVDELLKEAGARDVMRQSIGIDLDAYRVMPEVQRKRKVVFVGSSYVVSQKRECSQYSGNDEVIEELGELLKDGRPITNEIIEHLGGKYNIPAGVIYERHMNYVVRERAVEWLCQCDDIEVEVYGRYWESNEIVRPFFRGELPYGEAVARVYNEAQYALSLSAIEVNTQRLAEMGACGCIPVVYDSRHRAEEPHWNNECLFFRTRQDLYECFHKIPSGNPEEIGRAFSYDVFAEKILTIIQEREGVSCA